jgi:prepilin-type N-terminal cleavage/methylation domain-containing protein
MNRQGFTLIELMVVIVIIGVLASLAIPRFTEASAKAKVAEAPRVIASYESAFLAAVPEMTKTEIEKIKGEELIVDVPKDSKWFTYKFGTDASTVTDGKQEGDGLFYIATANDKMGRVAKDDVLTSGYEIPADDAADGDTNDCFNHKFNDSDTDPVGKAMVPSFLNSGCKAVDNNKAPETPVTGG